MDHECSDHLDQSEEWTEKRAAPKQGCPFRIDASVLMRLNLSVYSVSSPLSGAFEGGADDIGIADIRVGGIECNANILR